MDIASFMSTTSSLKRRKKERKMKKMKEDKWEGKRGKAPLARRSAVDRFPPPAPADRARWIESLSRQPVVTLRRRRRGASSQAAARARQRRLGPARRRGAKHGGSARPSVVVASWDRRLIFGRTKLLPPPTLFLRRLNIKPSRGSFPC